MERYIEDMETLVAGPKQVFGTTDTLPRRRPQTAPPHARDSAPLVSNALPGLELRRPSPVPHPRRSLLAWPSPHPHCKLEDHPASPRVAGRRVLISDLRQAGEAALPPVLQPHGPHEACARQKSARRGWAAAPGSGQRSPRRWARLDAAPSRMEPPRKKVSQLSRRAIRWLGLDCCTFFFVRCIFRNKKKSPTLHTTSSASQDQKPAPWLREIEPRTPQGVGWDGHLRTALPTESPIRVGSAPGL
ncbi:uncharacterized protein LOC104649969 isoform X2 [Saimiri boliviensis]|uniref:uncharacterized protein LOC104649969 isoform X2 n=1 Tax=Saimiri boliviensis TaxID=27679 RepID=UPI003D786D0A